MRKLILFLIISAFLSSCDKDFFQQEISDDLPYAKKIVINGMLETNKDYIEIQVTRTLPPLGRIPDTEEYYITDADVMLYWDNDSLKMNYMDNSSSLYYVNITPVQGKKYKVVVKWQGLTASGETIVPNAKPKLISTSIDSVYYKYSYGGYYNFLSFATFELEGEYAYRMASSSSPGSYSYSYYNKVKKSIEGLNKYREQFYTDYSEPNYDMKPVIILYDTPYFYYSQTNGYSNNDNFFGNGINPTSNIQGDGIGIFAGSQVVFLNP